jgi:hypothetical protein
VPLQTQYRMAAIILAHLLILLLFFFSLRKQACLGRELTEQFHFLGAFLAKK